MLDRMCVGEIPAKPHLVFRSETGALYYEECFTRRGFDGPFSILYHAQRPHEASPIEAPAGFRIATAVGDQALLKRHYRCLDLSTHSAPESLKGTATEPSKTAVPGSSVVGLSESRGIDATALTSRTPLLFNHNVVIGFSRPTRSDTTYFANGDADDLYFVLRGSGTLRSVFGDLAFRAGDYVSVPKATIHRFVLDEGVPQAWLSIECKDGLGLPAHYRNAIGQLRMDAPYSHRDFKRPTFRGPVDEGIRDVVVKRSDSFFGFRSPHSPLDVVGWDGTVFPFVFPILAFQPRVGQVHLPPPAHATFEAGGALICSFVPRPLDFHESANPCPYPHSSVDIDEVLFYANDAFASRRGIGEGSLSLHPAGIAHGPHPGAYENAPGQTRTEEIAVMLDCTAPLRATAEARAVEDPDYHRSFGTA